VYQSCCAPSAAPPLNNAATFLALRLGVTHLHFANLPGNLIEPCPIPLAPILRDFRLQNPIDRLSARLLGGGGVDLGALSFK
jgi:hypothetical protein